MYTLYYMPGRANLAPHIVLQETAARYCLELVDFENQGQRSPEYLTLNPNGRVPTLIEGGFVMYEAAAITMYIADQHKEAGLAPPPATLSRARYYQWMVHLTNSVQEALNQWFHPNHFVSGSQSESLFKKNFILVFFCSGFCVSESISEIIICAILICFRSSSSLTFEH